MQTPYNTVHIQFDWFGVLIKFRVQYLSRGADFDLVGLSNEAQRNAKPS